MKTKIKIEGVIVQHTCRFFKGTHGFRDYLTKDDFSDHGVYVDSSGDTHIYITDHTIEIEVDLPNVEQAQLKALDAKENVLREKFAADMMNIKVERSKLMALTNEVNDD